MKERFLIRGLGGKKRLNGEISVGGAKNAALKLFAATLLFKGPVVIDNIPDIEDARRMAEILDDMGALVERLDRRKYKIDTSPVSTGVVNAEMAKRIRASVVLTGPLLSRFGHVSLPHPGGDVIGARPIDFFLSGFKAMGAVIELKNEQYTISTKNKKLKGTEIFFPFQSVTGTETFMMAGVLAQGKTVIKNAAMEPEIVELAEFLIAGGAKIAGAGTPTIIVEGGGDLSLKKPWKVMPDRLEAGSFLILGALAADNIEITDCRPDHLESVIELLRRSGVSIETKKDKLIIKNNAEQKTSSWKAVNLKTHEYPGFPTDLQAPMVVFLTQVMGESLVFETIFEGRLSFAENLVYMGADIKVWDPHRASVRGATPLRGRELESPDIRAGLAFLIAGLIAKGESVTNNVYHIDRGYEAIEKRLLTLGASIERVR